MKYSLLFFLGIILFTSCRKDPDLLPKGQTIPGNMTWLFAPDSETAHLQSLPVSGLIGIGHHSFHHNQTFIHGGSLSISGHICDMDGIESDFGTFSINSSTASVEPDAFQNAFGYSQLTGLNEYNTFFRSTNYYSLEGNPGRDLPGFDNEPLYFPDAMIISSPFTKSGYGPSLGTGSLITWNADPDNPNGVAVVIELDPITNGGNMDLISPVQLTIRKFYVPDNGQIVLTQELLKYFPEHAILKIQIGRGNYGRVQATNATSTYTIGLLNYATSSFHFTYYNE